MIVVMVEHIIIAAKFVIAIIIKDKPEWVSKEEHEKLENLENLFEMIDDKKDEYKAKGGVLLEDKINHIKD